MPAFSCSFTTCAAAHGNLLAGHCKGGIRCISCNCGWSRRRVSEWVWRCQIGHKEAVLNFLKLCSTQTWYPVAISNPFKSVEVLRTW